MEIRIQEKGPEDWHAQALVCPACEEENLAEKYSGIDQACPWLAIAPAVRDFRAKKGELAVFYGHPDLRIPRIVAVGLGKRSEVTTRDIREALGSAARKCRKLGLESALLLAENLEGFPGGLSRLVEECVCGFSLGLYEFSELKTRNEESPSGPDWFAIGLTEPDEGVRRAAQRGHTSARATTLGRDLDNLPGNMLYPETLALRANGLAEKNGFKCTVISEEGLKEIGAGCLLAVGQGSVHPPRMIILDYAGKGCEAKKPLVLVGKGITFDSGGLCLKPAANMNQMKCDMSGAAAVLAVLTAAASEKLDAHIVGILACAENMPDGRAYRPGDVLTALNGETVEVINTDAEGRLALADALAYACKNYEPAAIVDIATLTGACAVALGNGLAGLFSDDDRLAARIVACGEVTGENCWRLPLWEPYREALKSEVADISHTASREGGAITAALFLKNFVKSDIPWAHLDIAAVDWVAKKTPLCTEGASGFGARTLLELARGSQE